jgi:LPS-assembly lipoprotein
MSVRRRLAVAIVCAGLVALGGCGFTPLYGPGGVTAGLSHITVEAPDGRTAYLLRERLEDALLPRQGARPLYRLTFTVIERRDPRGLGPDDAASRYELTIVVAYTLTEIATGAALHSGEETVLISYDAVDAPYAGIAAQQNSQERAAAEAARRIRLNLAEYFAGRS